MQTSRVLFIGGSIGLGHAGRDVAIARALRALNPSVEISWLVGDPARRLIADAGETLLPDPVADETASAEGIAGHFALNVAQYAWRERSAWTQNVATFKQLTDRYPFDPVVGDETYELLGAFAKHPTLKRSPFTMIYDFVGLDSASRNPLERLLVHAVNRSWCRGGKPPVEDLALMIGQPDDREQHAHRVQARASGIVGLGHQQAMPISPTATMGTLIMNTEPHQSPASSRPPPTNGPSARATPLAAAQMAIARPRCCSSRRW